MERRPARGAARAGPPLSPEPINHCLFCRSTWPLGEYQRSIIYGPGGPCFQDRRSHRGKATARGEPSPRHARRRARSWMSQSDRVHRGRHWERVRACRHARPRHPRGRTAGAAAAACQRQPNAAPRSAAGVARPRRAWEEWGTLAPWAARGLFPRLASPSDVTAVARDTRGVRRLFECPGSPGAAARERFAQGPAGPRQKIAYSGTNREG